MKQRREKISVEVAWVVAESDPARGIFRGGPTDPAHLDELTLWVERGERFDGSDAVHLRGSARALDELGRYLLALSRHRTLDPAYHDHFDDVKTLAGRPRCALIVRAPTDRELGANTVERETIEVELRYLDDDAGQASGVQSPAFADELMVGFDHDEGLIQIYCSGSRRALAALGAYALALSRASGLPAGYFDTVESRLALIVHAPG